MIKWHFIKDVCGLLISVNPDAEPGPAERDPFAVAVMS